MPRKAKTATSSDLPSWVDSCQEQGLYFLTREDAIESLQFTEEAFKKAAARLTKKTGSCVFEGAFLSSSSLNRNKDSISIWPILWGKTTLSNHFYPY